MTGNWLAIEFPRLALDLATRDTTADEPALAITHEVRGRPVIVDHTTAAERLGVRNGMAVAAALAVAGNLVLRPRDPAAENHSLQRLAAWAYQYSSQVSMTPPSAMLCLEVGSSRRLFGRPAALRQRLAGELHSLGYRARTGTAPTPAAASLAARDECDIDTTEALERYLSGLPLASLGLDPGETRALQGMGFRHTRELLRLPRAALARRLGPALLDRLDRLRGHRPDPRPAWHPPDHYRAGLDLNAEVHEADGLLFPLQRMIREFCGVLRGGDHAVQSVAITLRLREGRQCFRLGLQAPGRDEARFLALLRERLARLQLGTPALAIELEASTLLPFEAPETDLFGDSAGTDSDLDAVLDRLRARLGDDAVSGLGGVEEHRPEYSWRALRPGEDSPCPPLPHRPAWLCQPARPCAVSHLKILAGPERIETGWWDGRDCRRDYYVMRDPHGAALWVYREYKPASGWYLHGIFG